jgi:hypothetical protein
MSALYPTDIDNYIFLVNENPFSDKSNMINVYTGSRSQTSHATNHFLVTGYSIMITFCINFKPIRYTCTIGDFLLEERHLKIPWIKNRQTVEIEVVC